MTRVFIIAEAGVNHNGELGMAKLLVDAAAMAGADAVKFQTWRTELLVSRDLEQAKYQSDNTNVVESQFSMLKRLELSDTAFCELKDYCEEQKIIFMSTPDDVESATFLSDLQDIFKIGSGGITDLHLLRYIGSLEKKIILSTGMSTIKEIEEAIYVLQEAGTHRDQMTILHCTTEYPVPINEVNLRAMQSLGDSLGVQVGYSDHTLGIEAAIAAVALGATVIEKHFTLDVNLPGPDHKASLEPRELKAMIEAIRNVEEALGNGLKEVTPSEKKNRAIVRKSIVASRKILIGEELSVHNLTTKRAGEGVSPMLWNEVIGRTAIRNYSPEERIEL